MAQSAADLHSDSNKLGKENSFTEKGAVVNGRGDTPNRHDILTGSQMDGTLATGTGDTTCGNWTSAGEGSALVGHHDKQGGGANPIRGTPRTRPRDAARRTWWLPAATACSTASPQSRHTEARTQGNAETRKTRG